MHSNVASTTWLAGPGRRQSRRQGQIRSQMAAPHVLALAALVVECVVCGCKGCVARLEASRHNGTWISVEMLEAAGARQLEQRIEISQLRSAIAQPTSKARPHAPAIFRIGQALTPLHPTPRQAAREGAAGWAPRGGRAPSVGHAWGSEEKPHHTLSAHHHHSTPSHPRCRPATTPHHTRPLPLRRAPLRAAACLERSPAAWFPRVHANGDAPHAGTHFLWAAMDTIRSKHALH